MFTRNRHTTGLLNGPIMILHTTLTILFAFFSFVFAQNFTQLSVGTSKTKRTISDQLYGHGDARGVIYYTANSPLGDFAEPLATASSSSPVRNFFSSPPTKPLALVSVQQPVEDSPKQVADQQVLYEFQQPPPNALPNIQSQATQPFGSLPQPTPFLRPQALGLTGNHPASAPTVVSPVHHNIFTNHALNSFSNSLLPQQQQQFQNAQLPPDRPPGKFIYLNGKIIVNPSPIVPQANVPHNHIFHKGVYHNQQKLPLVRPPIVTHQQAPVHANLGLTVGAPQGQIPFGVRLQARPGPPITTQNRPSAPVQPEENEEEEENEPAEEDGEEEADDEDDDKEDASSENHDEEDDDDDDHRFEEFPFDDDHLDEEESHYFKPPKYRGRNKHHDHDEEHDEDGKRSASKLYSKYHRYPAHGRRHRKSPKHSFANYKFFASPKKEGKKTGKKSKHGKQKKTKSSKNNNEGRHKFEFLDGKFSEIIPITHKQKVHKERWYLSENIDPPKKTKTAKKIK